MNKLICSRIGLLFVLTLFYGCAGNSLDDLVYPPPPETPRIKYITAFSGDTDFMKASSVASAVLLGSSGGAVSIGKPMGIHASKDGRLFVTDTAFGDVVTFDGNKKSVFMLSELTTKMFIKPIGFAIDKDGRAFVTDSQRDDVSVFDKDFKSIGTLLPDGKLDQPSGIAIDNERNRAYVVDTYGHHVRVFDLTTLKQTSVIGERGKEDGKFNFPSNVAVDSKGNLWVVDTQNGRVQKFDPDGRFLLRFGEFGDLPGMFARPRGIAIDSEDHIYVVDAAFNNVQIFDEEGQILLFFGSYGSGRGNMILPAGVAIDKDDFIYVVDSWNARVLKYEFLGEKHKAREEEAKKKKK